MPDGTIVYYTETSTTERFNEEEIEIYNNAMENCTWTCFEKFKKTYSSIWKVTLIPEQWTDSTCNCPVWSKIFTCKHVNYVSLFLQHNFIDEFPTILVNKLLTIFLITMLTFKWFYYVMNILIHMLN